MDGYIRYSLNISHQQPRTDFSICGVDGSVFAAVSQPGARPQQRSLFVAGVEGAGSELKTHQRPDLIHLIQLAIVGILCQARFVTAAKVLERDASVFGETPCD